MQKDGEAHQHAEVMAGLSGKLDQILEFLPRGSKIAYVDYPAHFNVGDLLIYAGTERFFRDAEYRISCRLSLTELGAYDVVADTFAVGRSFKVLDRAMEEGAALVLHGGGNVGDIYPEHQVLREVLIRRYKQSQVILLPQSVHYGDIEKQKRAADIIREHRRVVVFVRDAASETFRQMCGAAGGMLPDMAQRLWSREDFVAKRSIMLGAGAEPLVLGRRDVEGAPIRELDQRSFDWDDLIGVRERSALKLFQAMALINPAVGDALTPCILWERLSESLISSALDRLSQSSAIHTDRLHGMIAGSLLAKPVWYSDNSYGKLGRYYSAWLEPSPLICRMGRNATGE